MTGNSNYIGLNEGKKIYFISDIHLGVPDALSSLEREKKLLQWLHCIKPQLGALFILGDLFDFWFEYRHVVPRGYQRVLGYLSALHDEGIPVYFFKGNHDMWTFGYLEKEVGMKVFSHSERFICNGIEFETGHGDGLGPGDNGYKLIKALFASRVTQWLFARIHPNGAFGIARFFSRWSRNANHTRPEKFISEETEFLIRYIKSTPADQRAMVYIFGHRHLVFDLKVDNSHYYNLGEWFNEAHYVEFDGKTFNLCRIEDAQNECL